MSRILQLSTGTNLCELPVPAILIVLCLFGITQNHTLVVYILSSLSGDDIHLLKTPVASARIWL